MFRNKIAILLLFTLIFCLFGHAQYQGLLRTPYKNKVYIIDTLYRKLINNEDASKTHAFLKEMEAYGLKYGDREIVLEVELFKAYYYSYWKFNNPHDIIIQKLKAIEKKGNEEGYLHIEARAIRVLAEHYWRRIGNYELASEYYLKLGNLLQKTDAVEFPNAAEYYYLIGELHYFFKDYVGAMSYVRKALAVAETDFNWKAIWSAKNTMGLCYRQLGKLDSADYYFKDAVRSKYLKKNDIQYSIAQGNIGYNYYLRKKYDKAIPLILLDAIGAVKEKDWRLAAGAGVPLANIYLQQKQYDKSWAWIEKSHAYIQKSNRPPHELLEQFFTVKSAWYVAKGNAVMAKKYLDSAWKAKEEVQNKINALQLLRVQQKEYRQKLAAERTEFLLKQRIKDTQVLVLIIVVVFLGILVVLIYYLQRRKRLMIEAAKDAKLKLANRELEIAKHQIDIFAQTISANSELIEEMQVAHEYQQSEAITLVTKNAILTDASWDKFQEAFEKVHPGYIRRLREKIHGITLAETKMVVLAKLKLNKREMGHALGISPQSLRVTWHRLRKKIENDEIQLEDFVDQI
ncbi:tetratricopeptide repeat protein [Pedobacter ureilyticus]|uniref:Tetratricopeptide repeat protein n=1 Tax=Pedobacter ureilyticus TaxID=1393051 RepID=A0ABW9J4J8_9SPHI|nr:tetratricopeptide repeat protein [Pedobacter helvus]